MKDMFDESSEFDENFDENTGKGNTGDLNSGDLNSGNGGAGGIQSWRLARVVAATLPELASLESVIAQLQARKAQLEASLMEAVIEDGETNSSTMIEQSIRYVQAELAPVLRKGEQTVAISLNSSYDICNKYPEVFKKVKQGSLSFLHAKAISDAGMNITDPTKRTLFEAETLAVAMKTTTGSLRYLARKIAEKYVDTPFEERHKDAMQDRNVTVYALEDGMASLQAVMDAVTAFGIKNRIDEIARKEHKAQQETETTEMPARLIGEIRADVLADLLLTGKTSAHINADNAQKPGSSSLDSVKAIVRVTIPVDTLITSDDSHTSNKHSKTTYLTGAELENYGPVSVKTIKQLAGAASSWERIFTHPITGMVLGTDNYEPTKNMRRLLTFRDKHCRFPGCRRIPDKSETDHTKDWALGGKTHLSNLAFLCKSHHRLKHAVFLDKTRWSVTQDEYGTLTWVSPQGHKHIDKPEDLMLHEAKPDTIIEKTSDDYDCPF